MQWHAMTEYIEHVVWNPIFICTPRHFNITFPFKEIWQSNGSNSYPIKKIILTIGLLWDHYFPRVHILFRYSPCWIYMKNAYHSLPAYRYVTVMHTCVSGCVPRHMHPLTHVCKNPQCGSTAWQTNMVVSLTCTMGIRQSHSTHAS